MTRKFKCIRAWTRHSQGQIIEEYEYNRLPFEVKPQFQELAVSELIEVELDKPTEFPIGWKYSAAPDIVDEQPVEELLEDFIAERIHPEPEVKAKKSKRENF